MIRKSPFKFLDSYQKRDYKIFFGRQKETKDLYNALSGVKHLLVYGPSGAGKTSLIECGLRNQFSSTDWFALTIRKGSNINASIFSGINEKLKNKYELDSTTNLPIDDKIGFENMVERLFKERYKPVYLLFDQFEELLISGSPEEQRIFFTNLDKLIHYQLPCRVLLIMREEFVGYLSEFEKYCPTIFQHRFRLEKIRRANAREVIFNTLESRKFKNDFTVIDSAGFSGAILDKLPDNRNEIELTHVQVFLNELWERANNKTDDNSLPVLAASLLREKDSLDTILDTFLKKQLKSMEASYGENIPLEILACLISDRNTKIQLTQSGLSDELQRKTVEVNDLSSILQAFKRNKIIRDITLNDEQHFEITHDILAQVIGDNKTEDMRLRKKARSVYEVYQEREGVFKNEDINDIERYQSFLPIPDELQQRIKTSREILEAEEKAELKAAQAQADKETKLRQNAENAQHQAELEKVKAEKQKERAENATKKATRFSRISIIVAITAILAAALAISFYRDTQNSLNALEKEKAERQKTKFEALKKRADVILKVKGCPTDILQKMNKIAVEYPDSIKYRATIKALKEEQNPDCK